MDWDDTIETMYQNDVKAHERLISEWAKNSNVITPIGYYRDITNKILTIYTDKPGYLIGKGGKNKVEFMKKYNAEFNAEYTCYFVEVNHFVVNLQ